MEQFKVNNFLFQVEKWGMQRQLKNERFILPIITGPLVTALSAASEPELLIPATVSGLLDSLASVDLEFIATVLLEGADYMPPGKVMQKATFQSFDENGFDIGDLHEALAQLIMLQYGALIKKGLQGTLTNALKSLMPESLPSTNE